MDLWKEDVYEVFSGRTRGTRVLRVRDLAAER